MVHRSLTIGILFQNLWACLRQTVCHIYSFCSTWCIFLCEFTCKLMWFFLSALKRVPVSCVLLTSVWWLIFACMYLYFIAVLQCFPILCYLPAWLTRCIPMILLLFHAWDAVSASRIVEDNNKETGEICPCYWWGAPPWKPGFLVDTVTVPNVEDICVEICGGWMNLEPSEQPEECSVSLQNMDSMAELYSNETYKEAFPIQQDSGGVHLVQHFCISLQSALSCEQSLLININPEI